MDNLSYVIRAHVKRGIDSFYKLKQSQKREIAAYELISGRSGFDMIENHDGEDFTKLIFKWYVKKELSAQKTLNKLLDDIIKRYASNFDETFQYETDLEIFKNHNDFYVESCLSEEDYGVTDADFIDHRSFGSSYCGGF